MMVVSTVLVEDPFRSPLCPWPQGQRVTNSGAEEHEYVGRVLSDEAPIAGPGGPEEEPISYQVVRGLSYRIDGFSEQGLETLGS